MEREPNDRSRLGLCSNRLLAKVSEKKVIERKVVEQSRLDRIAWGSLSQRLAEVTELLAQNCS